MVKLTLGILHPGEMGISLAASAKNTGHDVYWVSAGRSDKTRTRAQGQGLEDAGTLEKLCNTCPVIVSVCPPHAAEEQAQAVLACGFKGIYVDANAISPQHTRHLYKLMSDAGIAFIDGGVIGPPAWKPGTTWLYLSGTDSERIPPYFASGPLQTGIIGEGIGEASALKMCYAAFNKGSISLLCAVLAAAEQLGVREDLLAHWEQEGSYLAGGRAEKRVESVIRKAWRFTGEMDEIAETFEHTGVTGEFHRAAKHLYELLVQYRDISETPPIQEILKAMVQSGADVIR